jgi:membrane protease YdiL (CAAX protease family)
MLKYMAEFWSYFLLMGIALADIGAIIVWAVHEDRLTQGEKPLLAIRWSLAEIFLGTQAAFVASLLPTVTLAMVLFSNDEWIARNTSAQIVILSVLILSSYTAMAGVVAFFIRIRYKLRWSDIGLGSNFSIWQIAAGILVGLLLVIISEPIQNLIHFVINHLRGAQKLQELQLNDSSNSLPMMLKRVNMTPTLIAAILFVTCIIAPFAEELIFRGLFFNAIRHRFSLWVGAFASGLIFAVLHGSLLYLPVFWVLGIVLALAYYKSRSLWLVIVAHATNNLIATLKLIEGIISN